METHKLIVTIISILVLLLGLSIHEWAHAKFADMAGDPTPRLMGRVTLNPLKHLDPLGTIMIVVTSFAQWGIGWGKPVMVNPSKMRNPRWDHFTSVAAGPISNLVQAAIYALVFRLVLPGRASVVSAIQGDDYFLIFLALGVMLNVFVFVFNLIPLGPLDGHWLVGAFLPEPARQQWYAFNRGIGSFIFLLLVLVPGQSVFSYFLIPAASFIISFLLGRPLL